MKSYCLTSLLICCFGCSPEKKAEETNQQTEPQIVTKRVEKVVVKEVPSPGTEWAKGMDFKAENATMVELLSQLPLGGDSLQIIAPSRFESQWSKILSNFDAENGLMQQIQMVIPLKNIFMTTFGEKNDWFNGYGYASRRTGNGYVYKHIASFNKFEDGSLLQKLSSASPCELMFRNDLSDTTIFVVEAFNPAPHFKELYRILEKAPIMSSLEANDLLKDSLPKDKKTKDLIKQITNMIIDHVDAVHLRLSCGKDVAKLFKMEKGQDITPMINRLFPFELILDHSQKEIFSLLKLENNDKDTYWSEDNGIILRVDRNKIVISNRSRNEINELIAGNSSRNRDKSPINPVFALPDSMPNEAHLFWVFNSTGIKTRIAALDEKLKNPQKSYSFIHEFVEVIPEFREACAWLRKDKFWVGDGWSGKEPATQQIFEGRFSINEKIKLISILSNYFDNENKKQAEAKKRRRAKKKSSSKKSSRSKSRRKSTARKKINQ